MNQVSRKFITRLIAAGCCACLSLAAHAAGLGRLTVQSALGQPLSVEIEVTGLQPDEFLQVLARIANAEQYQAAKLAYAPPLRQLRIAAERHVDGRSVLKITSVAPINEPTLDLLVDFNWRGGRLLQKYAVLLDPPR